MRLPITVILGGDNPKYVHETLIELRKALAPLKQKAYSPAIDKIEFKVGISGTIHKFKDVPDGASNFRVFAKRGSASADIIAHDRIWKQGEKEFARFLAESLLQAAEELGRRIEKAGMECDSGALHADLQAALKSFLQPR